MPLTAAEQKVATTMGLTPEEFTAASTIGVSPEEYRLRRAVSDLTDDELAAARQFGMTPEHYATVKLEAAAELPTDAQRRAKAAKATRRMAEFAASADPEVHDRLNAIAERQAAGESVDDGSDG